MLFLMMSLSFLGHFEVTIPTWFLPQGMQRNDGLFGEFMAGVMGGPSSPRLAQRPLWPQPSALL